MKISKEEFEKIANLSALKFDVDNNDKLIDDLGRILSRFQSLQKIDTTNIAPTAHVTNLVNSLREDKDSQILNEKDVLSNAKEINMQQVKIPRVFDNEWFTESYY